MKAYFDNDFYLILEPETVTEWMALRYWSTLHDDRGENRILVKRLPEPEDARPAPAEMEKQS